MVGLSARNALHWATLGSFERGGLFTQGFRAETPDLSTDLLKTQERPRHLLVDTVSTQRFQAKEPIFSIAAVTS